MVKRESRKEEETSPEQQLEEKVLYINRTAKVVKGGRKFGFSALILVGDLQGRVGFGFAKANEVSDAIRKGTDAARRNLVTIEREGTTIPYEISVHWDGVKLMMKPAKEGTGVIAGPIVGAVLKFAGIGNVVTKIHGSNCPLNQVRAVFLALEKLMNRQKILEERGCV